MSTKKLNILIIGGLSREHAIAWKIKDSPRLGELYIAPGNGGTTKLAQSLDIDIFNSKAIISACKKHSIDLVEIGPDDVLATNMADELRIAGILVFGPSQSAAKIEYSKSYAKDIMNRSGINTASYKEFSDYNDALDYLKNRNYPLVIKADGLALGKGVVICQSVDEGINALHTMMRDKVFGESGNKVIIEQFLEGTEISTHAFCDGKTYKMFPSSQDHKQIYNGDQGPNTGGMGTIVPLSWVSQADVKELGKQLVEPLLSELAKDGNEYIGCLYPGLILKDGNYNVVEYNSRFGDPELQSYLRLLETDLVDILEACATGKLDSIDIRWAELYACCIVLASGGYPSEYKKGQVITGIDEAEKLDDVVVFHAGTKLEGDKLVTNGGRVISVTATGKTLDEALGKAYRAVKKIHFEGMQYRTDIGKRPTPKWQIIKK